MPSVVDLTVVEGTLDGVPSVVDITVVEGS